MRPRWSSATVAAIAGLLIVAQAARGEVLFEQGPSSVGFHPTSQDFETSLDANDALAADDFRVPTG